MASTQIVNLFGVDDVIDREVIIRMALNEKLERFADCFAFETLIESECPDTKNYRVLKLVSTTPKKYVAVIDKREKIASDGQAPTSDATVDSADYLLNESFALKRIEKTSVGSDDIEVWTPPKGKITEYATQNVQKALKSFASYKSLSLDEKIKYLLFNAHILSNLDITHLMSYFSTTKQPIRYLLAYLYGYDGTFTANLRDNVVVRLLESDNILGFFTEVDNDAASPHKINYATIDTYDRFVTQTKNFKFDTYTTWIAKTKKKIIEKNVEINNIVYESEIIDPDNENILRIYIVSYDLVINKQHTVKINHETCENHTVHTIGEKKIEVVLQFDLPNRSYPKLDDVVKKNLFKNYETDIGALKLTKYDFVKDPRKDSIVLVQKVSYTNEFLVNDQTKKTYDIEANEKINYPDENKTLVSMLTGTLNQSQQDVTKTELDAYDFQKLNMVVSSSEYSTMTRVSALIILTKKINAYYGDWDLGSQIVALFLLNYFTSGSNTFTTYDYLLNVIGMTYVSKPSLIMPESLMDINTVKTEPDRTAYINMMATPSTTYFQTISGNNNGISGMCVEYCVIDLLNYFYMKEDFTFDIDKMIEKGLHQDVVNFYKSHNHFVDVKSIKVTLVDILVKINGEPNVSAKSILEFVKLLTKLYGLDSSNKTFDQILSDNCRSKDTIKRVGNTIEVRGNNNINFDVQGQHAKTIKNTIVLDTSLKTFSTFASAIVTTSKIGGNIQPVLDIMRTLRSAKSFSETKYYHVCGATCGDEDDSALARFYVNVIEMTLNKLVAARDTTDTKVILRANNAIAGILTGPALDYVINIGVFMDSMKPGAKKTKGEILLEQQASKIADQLNTVTSLIIEIVPEDDNNLQLLFKMNNEQRILDVSFNSNDITGPYYYTGVVTKMMDACVKLEKSKRMKETRTSVIGKSISTGLMSVQKAVTDLYNPMKKTSEEIQDIKDMLSDALGKENFGGIITAYNSLTKGTAQEGGRYVSHKKGGNNKNKYTTRTNYQTVYNNIKRDYSSLCLN